MISQPCAKAFRDALASVSPARIRAASRRLVPFNCFCASSRLRLRLIVLEACSDFAPISHRAATAPRLVIPPSSPPPVVGNNPVGNGPAKCGQSDCE